MLGFFLQVSGAMVPAHIAGMLEGAVDRTRSVEERILSIRRLGRAEYAHVGDALLRWVGDAQEPEPIRLAAVAALSQISDPSCVQPLLKGWDGFPNALKQSVSLALTTRRPLTGELVTQLEAGVLALKEIDTATRQRLIQFPEEDVAARARRLFQREPLLDANLLFDRFKPALDRVGRADPGRAIFRQRACFNCHRLSDEGVFVGADLYTVKDLPKEELLRNILAPNLFFMPNFQLFVAESEEGDLFEGLVAGTTSATVTLRRAMGDQTVLHKSDIKRLKGMNVSLMPEGLLEGLSHQEVADLLEFIREGGISQATRKNTTAGFE